jgi:multiple sugar transport system ATP-binding protein
VAEIVLEDVWKVYPGGTEAVRSLDLAIADGEFVVLVGPSGCGKTTALRMVAGLEEISKGTVRIGDKVVNDVPPKERDIAMVFQNYALYPHMTVFDNMAFGLKLQKLDKDEIGKRVREAGAILGLDELLERKPAALSGGQRQRVAMGRAIVRHPQAFLMDEPLSNLDAKLRVQMRSEIARIQHDLGVTTIYVTHDQTEAMTMGDRVAVIRKGVLQQVDSPQSLYEHPVNLFVAGFIGSPAMNLFDAKLTGEGDSLAVEFGGFRLPVPPEVLSERPARLRGSHDRPGHPPRGHGGRLAGQRRAARAPHLLHRGPARGPRLGRRRPRDDLGAARPDRRHEGAPLRRRPGGAGAPRAAGPRRAHDGAGPAQPEVRRRPGRADRARGGHPSTPLLRSR